MGMTSPSNRYRAAHHTTKPRLSTKSWRAAAEWLLPYAMPAAMLMACGRRAQLRQALHLSRSALHAMREHLDGIVSLATVGVVQTTLDGRILLANQWFCGLVEHGTAHPRTLRLHDMTHPDDRPSHLEQHAKMLATGEPCEFESRLVGADESHVWVTGHMALTHDPRGRPVHVVGAMQDISHQRETEAALHALTETLEQRVVDAVAERVALQEERRAAQQMEALGQLADGVAHDFNNVLQAIAGGARLIQRRPGDPASVQRLAALVVDAAERGATVTELLMSFARRGPLQPSNVDGAELLTELRDIMAGSLGARISVEVAVSDRLLPLYADRGQLQAVLVSLATNARDALADDPGTLAGARPVLQLAAAVAEGAAAGLPPGRYVRIDVSDTGPGMDPLTLEHATEPFFTTKPRGSGTGLGLAVARGFAEQSGGRLILHSQAGSGTTASLWLPQSEPPHDRRTDAAPLPA